MPRLPLLPLFPVRDELLRFLRKWLPFAAVADPTALATAAAVGPSCIVIPSPKSSPKNPPEGERGLVGATIKRGLCVVFSLRSGQQKRIRPRTTTRSNQDLGPTAPRRRSIAMHPSYLDICMQLLPRHTRKLRRLGGRF